MTFEIVRALGDVISPVMLGLLNDYFHDMKILPQSPAWHFSLQASFVGCDATWPAAPSPIQSG